MTEPSLASLSKRRSRLASPQREKTYTVPRQWEESSFAHRSRRRLSPAPQKELSLMSHTDPPAATQYDWGIDREGPSVQARVRTEPPPLPLRENMTLSRRNRVSRHSMEMPCIYIDPPRASRPRHDSYRTAEFEAPLRTPSASCHRVGR